MEFLVATFMKIWTELGGGRGGRGPVTQPLCERCSCCCCSGSSQPAKYPWQSVAGFGQGQSRVMLIRKFALGGRGDQKMKQWMNEWVDPETMDELKQKKERKQDRLLAWRRTTTTTMTPAMRQCVVCGQPVDSMWSRVAQAYEKKRGDRGAWTRWRSKGPGPWPGGAGNTRWNFLWVSPACNWRVTGFLYYINIVFKRLTRLE